MSTAILETAESLGNFWQFLAVVCLVTISLGIAVGLFHYWWSWVVERLRLELLVIARSPVAVS